jgi:hypothetical protein
MYMSRRLKPRITVLAKASSNLTDLPIAEFEGWSLEVSSALELAAEGSGQSVRLA